VSPWLGIAVVCGLIPSTLVAVRALARRYTWHPETSRKTVHVVMGLVCLTFPGLFSAAWPVWLLAGISMTALAAIRCVPALRTRLGDVVGGVARRSWGDLLYAPAVALVFWLSRGDPLLFGVPVLVLALADAAAALVGQRYGFAWYETDDGRKSVEGSLAFFVTTFFATHVPLLLGTTAGRAESLLIGVLMGLLLVLLEAIAWRGLDNLFIPLATYLCFVRFTPLSIPELLERLLVLSLLLAGFAGWRRLTRLSPSAVVAGTLVLYVTWAVAGWRWLLPPLATLAGYTVLCRRPGPGPERHTVESVAWIGASGLLWIALSQLWQVGAAAYAYSVAYAAHLGMVALVFDARRGARLPLATTRASAVATLVAALGYGISGPAPGGAGWLALAAFPCITGAALAFAAWQPGLRDCPTDDARWARESCVATLAALVAYVVAGETPP
jgi:phytol kinase